MNDNPRVLRSRSEYERVYGELYDWCRSEDFAGYDPFDGLNSEYFRRLPFRHLATARLLFLQVVKRYPVNLRPLLRVSRGVNPKGVALFALAELSRFRTTGEEEHRVRAQAFLSQLKDLRLPLPEGQAAWGYNFDWQSRAFYAPRGTPTIVPTAFAAKAFAANGDLDLLGDVCRFIESGLNRSVDSADEVCFSYTPVDRSEIFNASLLAAECLAEFGSRKGDLERVQLASRAARFVLGRQRGDGAWTYGPKLRHSWVDSFHTAFILLSLHRIGGFVPEVREEARERMRRGLGFFIGNMFLEDGTPKYFDSEVFPVDIHSAAAAVAALSELGGEDPRCLPLAAKVLDWTIDRMRDPSGYFYYQVRRKGVVKTPFMRWGEAWMAYAVARYLESGPGN